MNIRLIMPFIFFIAMIVACKKDEFARTVDEIKALDTTSLIKVYNATVSSPLTLVYINDKKISGTAFGYGGLFPATTTYAAITPGNVNIKIKDTNTVSPKVILSINTTLDKAKYYSVLLFDTANKSKFMLVEDDIHRPADSSARIRFANLVFSSVPVTNVDIYSQNLKKNVFTNIPREYITPFIDHPSKKTDTFYVRATGTTTNLVTNNTTNATIFTPGVHRHYTIIFRGRYQTTGTGTTARGLTFMTNF